MEGGADFGDLGFQNAREDEPAVGAEFFEQAGGGGDEEFAVEVGQNDIGLLKFPGALGVGHREIDFFAPVRVDIFFRHADADGIEIERLDGVGSEFFRSDGEDSGARSCVECCPFRWQAGGDVAEEAQAGRRRRVVAGSEGHSRWQEDRTVGLRVACE